MICKLYKDVKAFYKDTGSVLLRHEAQNLVPLGNLILGDAGKDKTGWRNSDNWFMAAVSDDTGIRLTAVMTPPYNLTLYATDNCNSEEALHCLIDALADTAFTVNGVMTEKTLACAFAENYARFKGVSYAVTRNQRIYELEQISSDIPRIGVLRAAHAGDMAFLPYWIEGFNGECFGSPLSVQSDPERYLHYVSGGRLYILEDTGMPVSMAMLHREMQTVCGVGYVYTPPYFRKKGYASSCVAEISRLGLARGFEKCALYTDLANPISNSIYQKIGYQPICDSVEIGFK